MSQKVCRRGSPSRSGAAPPADFTTGWGNEPFRISVPAICDPATWRVDSQAARSVPAFQQFDGVFRDKDEDIQSLKQELANNQERHLQELDQALQDAERRAQQSTPVFAGTSTQPYATPVEKKTLSVVAVVAHAEAIPAFHSLGVSLGASAGNLNLKSRNKGSSMMVLPVQRRLRTKTPLAATHRVPSMGAMRRKENAPSFQYQPFQVSSRTRTSRRRQSAWWSRPTRFSWSSATSPRPST